MWLDRSKKICEKGNWFPIPYELVDEYAKEVKTGPFSIYICLLRHRNEKDDFSFPSQKLIAKKLGISNRTVIKYLKVLEQLGWIKTAKKREHNGTRRKNRYFFTKPSLWKKRLDQVKDKSPPCE